LAKMEELIKQALEQSKQRNFVESVELAINLKDVDLSIPKNRIDEEILLPNGRGKEVKVGLFGTPEMVLKAKGVADYIITEEEIEKLAEDKKRAKKLANEVQFFVAEAPLMPLIGKRLGIYLGTRGKMPKPIPPGADPKPLINTLKKSVRARSKDRRTFHVVIGTREMSPEQLAQNADAVLKRVYSKLERGKMNVESVYVKTTMGKSVRLM